MKVYIRINGRLDNIWVDADNALDATIAVMKRLPKAKIVNIKVQK